MKTTAIILAAGNGTRMNSPVPKQNMKILGKTVLYRATEAFQNCELIDSIVVVAKASEVENVANDLRCFSKLITVVAGGDSRAASSINGFNAIPSDTSFVAFHDAARCLITPEDIAKVVKDAALYGAATATCVVTDTVKRVKDGFICDTEDRTTLRTALTPQIFKKIIYSEAVSKIKIPLANITDDNMIVENAGFDVFCTDIGKENIKITVPEDVCYAEFVLQRREKKHV